MRFAPQRCAIFHLSLRAYFLTLLSQKSLENRLIPEFFLFRAPASYFFWFFLLSDLLSSSLLFSSLLFSSRLFSDSSHLCFSICPYCRKFDKFESQIPKDEKTVRSDLIAHLSESMEADPEKAEVYEVLLEIARKVPQGSLEDEKKFSDMSRDLRFIGGWEKHKELKGYLAALAREVALHEASIAQLKEAVHNTIFFLCNGRADPDRLCVWLPPVIPCVRLVSLGWSRAMLLSISPSCCREHHLWVTWGR